MKTIADAPMWSGKRRFFRAPAGLTVLQKNMQEEKKMELSQMLAMVDHTLLKPESTWAQIKAICDDAMKYHTATVCIPACYVARCKAYMQDRADKVGVCTVIGFPTGYSTTETKVFEAADAVKNGADEVDMVINIGMLKDRPRRRGARRNQRDQGGLRGAYAQGDYRDLPAQRG